MAGSIVAHAITGKAPLGHETAFVAHCCYALRLRCVDDQLGLAHDHPIRDEKVRIHLAGPERPQCRLQFLDGSDVSLYKLYPKLPRRLPPRLRGFASAPVARVVEGQDPTARREDFL